MSDVTDNGHPLGWALTTLGEPLNWSSGGTPLRSRTEYYNGDIPWAIIGDLTDGPVSETASCITELGLRESAAKWVQPGAVLLAMYGSIGKLGISLIPLTTNQAIAFTNPAPLDAKYLFYYLMSVRSDLISQGKGGTQSNISQTVIRGFPFLVAPVPEQRRIVSAIESYFTRLDDAVATLERVQRNLKRYRASVLKAAVEGRLVPTEAELARAGGRSYEPASLLLARILAERRRRWEEAELAKMTAKGKAPKDDKWKAKYVEPVAPDTSELPELPEGWCWASVESISSKVVDGVHKKPAYVETGIPFVTVKNLTAGPGISFESLRYITEADHEQFIARTDPERGDLLVSKDGTLGVVRAIRTDTIFSIFVSVALVKPVQREMTDYLEVALSSPVMQAQMVPKGSGLQHIHLEDLRADCVPVPPMAEWPRICAELQRHMSVAEELEREAAQSLARLARLRQSILKWAFEGRLVDQDPTDEPASVLLERIRAERAAAASRRGLTGSARARRTLP